MPNLVALNDMIEAETSALGFALVRIAWLPQGGQEGNDPVLQVMAERPDTRQLVIEDCTALSHRISDRLDAMEEAGEDPFEEPYRLEISSPGIDRPLTRLSDYTDWAGHEAKIELAEAINGQKRFRGELQGLEEKSGLVLLVDRDAMQHRLPFDEIDNAKLVLTDRLIASSAPVSSDGVDVIEHDNNLDA